jgi:hypothetical protein
MARKQVRPKATHEVTLDLLQKTGKSCSNPLRMARHGHRKVMPLEEVSDLTLKLYRCPNAERASYHQMRTFSPSSKRLL